MSILADPVPAIPFDARRLARSYYWRGYPVTQIAEELGLNQKTVQSWKQRDRWDDAPMIAKIEDHLEWRLNTLILKEKKTGADFKEIDLLVRQIERLARVRRYQAPGGHEGDLNEKVANRNAGPKKKAKRNHFTAEQAAELRRIFESQLFDYQETWWNALSFRTRMILKSRQIGATYYFAFEALIDAIETGRNQIFLSASKAQAHVFRSYIVGFAKLVGVDLVGDPIAITSELVGENEPAANLIFLGTNSKTAQSYSGNFYFDEFFWVHGFEVLNKVASGMATHKKWRKTYFSTPSTVAHQAYPYWTGSRKNKGRKKAEQIDIDVSHEALKHGMLCADRTWRHIVTVEDAEAGGCDLFDIEELRDEYAPDEFANLFLCQFVDDSLSAFKFNDLTACGCDSLIDWTDFNIDAARPFGNQRVWAGYDPQGSAEGDNAALVIMAPPSEPGGQFRLLEKHQLRGLDYQQQAEFIVAMLSRYNCAYLGVDATGVGSAVYQLLAKGPLASIVARIDYSLDFKAQMVMKAQNVIRRARIAWDMGATDVMSSFLSIKKTITDSGRNVTFKAGRSEADGHADLAWAIMHVLINEPLDGKERPKATMEIF
ncbi:terminase large subunit domain-containing protein [Sphingomonas cavernae]|uniref:Oxidoreductase n=1 Tax=Sphingomonas cavernae TaxID=2320861 RepID=A0A418WP08_9SPHN|nr:terminase family protein [Sphingomonas cavernae]RJF92972.1 oxidoreductase [Sphingomonas cavernae]